MLGAVEMRAEARALLINRPAIREAEHLVAAAVGQDRFCPADEAMQTAPARDEIVARTQVQMVRVAQQDLRAAGFEITMRDAFDGALRPDRHERRRLDVAVRGGQYAGARASLGVRDPESKRHVLSLVPG